ncbi:restriction endonuclease subunit S [bacterium]|nr:restriction endonuclease subunit S [bacterium]
MIRFDKKQNQFKNIFSNIKSLKNAGNTEKLEIVYKVWLTKEQISSGKAQEDSVYNLMMKNGNPKGELCVDAKEATHLYNVISELDDIDLMDLISSLTSAVLVGKALLDKFRKTVMRQNNGRDASILLTDIECYGSNLLDFLTSFDGNATISLATDNYIVFEIYVKLLKKYHPGLEFYNVGFYDCDSISKSVINDHNAVLLLPFNKFIDEDTMYSFDLNDLYSWITLLTDQKKPGMVIVPMHFFLSRRTGFGRGEFAKGGILKEISTIPASLLGMRSMTRYGLFITGKFGGKDLLVRNYADKNGELFVKEEATIKKDADFIVNSDRSNGWNVNKWLNRLNEDDVKFFSNKKRLGEMADVIRGRLFKQGHDEDKTRVKIVNISDIEDGCVNEITEAVEADLRHWEDHVLRKDDLLITIKGTTIKLAIFDKDDSRYVASPNLCAIRIKSEFKDNKLVVSYLKLYFDLPCGRRQLQSIKRGSFVMSVSKDDLLDLQIPVPEINRQKALCEKYKNSYEQYKTEIAAAEEKWKKAQAEFLQEL